MFSRFFLTGIVALLPTQNQAGTEELETAIYRVVPYETKFADINMRIRMAESILAYWNEFNSRVPRLSPTEREWLSAELGFSGERLNRIVQSPEFALSQLANHIDLCLSETQSIIDSQSLPATYQTEMFYWVKLLNCYDGSDDNLQYLRQAGLSNGKVDGAFNMEAHWAIQSTIINVIIPSAMAETMGWSLD